MHFVNKKLDRFKDVILNRPKPMKTTKKSNEESEMGRPSVVEFNAFLSNVRLEDHLFAVLSAFNFDLADIYRVKPMNQIGQNQSIRSPR